jgi:hypothetical protein
MRGKFLAAVLVWIFLSGSLSKIPQAMSWPSEDAVLIRNFGSNDNGRAVLGMIFSGGTEVLAAERGEVIFSRSKNDPASRLPSPLGAWTAVDHGDGLISIYSRYADESVSLTHVEKSQPIASAGNSGWSTHNGFYFVIFDRRDRRWINPAMIVTPLFRTNPPQILSVNLVNSQGVTVQSNNLTQGRYAVFVNAVSPPVPAAQQAARSILAPYRIICLVNGAEVGLLNFEAFYARDGVLMVSRNGLVPARQVYAVSPAFEVAEVFLTRGQVNLEIIVQDIAGNSRSLLNRLVVN